MKTMMMHKSLMVFAVAVVSFALAGAPAFASGHKPPKEDKPPKGPSETNVIVNPLDCSNYGAIPMVGAFKFGFDGIDSEGNGSPVVASVSLSAVSCVGWYNVSGSHDVTFGHAPNIAGHCDISGSDVCYLNMSQVAAALKARGHIIIGANPNVEYHCHTHEKKDMVGWIDLIVTN